MTDIHQRVARHKDLIIQTRRDLHRIPEVAYTEKKTSAYVADYLTREGYDIETGIAKYGVVALLESGQPGPTLMIRADMDALPITEETGLPFASNHDGVMHACGHDAHMAMVLGAATLFKELKNHLKGNIKFVFQPAEEGPGGAKPMIEAGVLDNPRVDYAIGCHVWPDLPSGCVGVRAGPFMAAMDRFDIKITGKGGHGAMPHLCVDALEVASQVVNALQRIASRHMDPLEPVVVTVGKFQAGTTFNIIPAEAVMCGTTRTFNPDIWDSWEARIEKIVRGVCESMGADFELNYQRGYPATINDESIAEIVRECAAETVGSDNVIEPPMVMGGEDFAFYLQKVKGCFFILGVGQEKDNAPIHNAKFNLNEEAMTCAVEIYCHAALRLLA
jgi:amidohydrolase